MFVLKLRKFGKSIGLILPKEMLDHLHAKEGQEIFAMETPTGYTITTLSPEVQRQIEDGDAIIDRYHKVFSALAK